MKMNFWLATLITLSVSGCASLNSVSLTQIPANRTSQVSSETDRWIFLGFNFDNNYADLAAKNLARKCPGGKITGILTKDELYAYFSVFVMKRRVVATGYCERGAVASTGTPAKRTSGSSSGEAEKVPAKESAL